jgi:cytochrome c5
MRAALLLIPLTLSACQAREEFAFSDTQVTLPDDATVLPDGPGVQLVTTACTACHSPAMILTQPHLTRKQWEATVEKMQHVFKAPVEDKDMPAIVDYLVTTNEALTR